MKLDSIYKRVDGRVGERGLLAHPNAHLAEIGSPARNVARDHAAADEDERLATQEAGHPFDDVPQHAQTRAGQALVDQRQCW